MHLCDNNVSPIAEPLGGHEVSKEDDRAAHFQVELTWWQGGGIDRAKELDGDRLGICGACTSFLYDLINILLCLTWHVLKDLFVHVLNIGILRGKDHAVQKIIRWRRGDRVNAWIDCIQESVSIWYTPGLRQADVVVIDHVSTMADIQKPLCKLFSSGISPVQLHVCLKAENLDGVPRDGALCYSINHFLP